MRVLFSTFGSFGDLYPYIAIGIELRNRGHEVTIATCPAYRAKVEAFGLNFHAVRPDIFLEDREMMAYMMDSRHGSERIVGWLAAAARDTYEDLSRAVELGTDVIVTHPLVFVAPLVVQKLRVPWVFTYTAPLSFFSAYDPPVLGDAPWVRPLRFLGARVTRRLLRLALRRVTSALNPVWDLQRELGDGASEPPDPVRLLAMFSQALAAPQRDWPSQTVITGFPFLDDGELDEEMCKFLDSGPAPVVFTLGSSAVATAGNFYRESLAAINRLAARAVFLTGSHSQDLPSVLPETIMVRSYAPHAPLFARAAVIVHHGGAGTTGQAMRSGRPMLVVPFGHDQFDNAQRIRQLGAGEMIRSYACAEKSLRRLLTNPSYARAAKKIADQVGAENGCKAAADVIEESIATLR
jgi:rhamnosyltransferase subunit B